MRTTHLVCYLGPASASDKHTDWLASSATRQHSLFSVSRLSLSMTTPWKPTDPTSLLIHISLVHCRHQLEAILQIYSACGDC